MMDANEMDMPALEQEITTLAGHLAAGTCRWLQLVAAFDAGGGWHGAGMTSCAQWLSWRCGLSTATAREQLRVARALPALPVVTATFAAGRLSFSKVRALTRVATAATETDLVEVATASTASQLDRLCSGIARARTDGEVLEQAAQARFTARWEPDGTLVFSGRLAAEDGAALLAALAAVGPDRVDAGACPDVDLDPHPADAPTGDAPGAATTTPGAATTPGATTTAALRDSAEPGTAVPEPSLPGVDDRDAAARAARSDAGALVALARHALARPPEAVGSAPVRLIIHSSAPACGNAPAGASPQADHVAETPADHVPATPAAAVLDAGPGIPLLPLSEETLARLACEALVERASDPDPADRHDAEGVDRAVPAAVGRHPVEHRFATAPQRRALLRRDGGCSFPGCPRRRGLHAHHVVPWSAGGPTSLANLALLCEHHHLLVHEGGWQLAPEQTMPEETRSRPGVGSGGSARRWAALGPAGQQLSRAPASSGEPTGAQCHHDADIAPRTITGTWAGERLDLPYAVSVLA